MTKHASVSPYPIQIFVFGDDQTLGMGIAHLLKIKPATHTIKKFPDGERLPYQTETVRDRDVYIIFTSQNGDKMDSHLIDYLRFVRAVREGQPYRITIILPKLPHQRQEVENRELRQPVLSDLFPELFQTAGANRIIVCRLHNPASRTRNPPMENLGTDLLIEREIRKRFRNLSKVALAAADMGGAGNVRTIARGLGGLPIIIVEKNRDKETNKSSPMLVFTDGSINKEIHTVIFIDDLISTFGTMSRAAQAVADKYPQIKSFKAFATHPDFIAPETHATAKDYTAPNIAGSKFDTIFVTDTVPITKNFLAEMDTAKKKLVHISMATLIAQTIDNLHNGKSVSSLWTKNGD